jgi:hypothetical protein
MEMEALQKLSAIKLSGSLKIFDFAGPGKFLELMDVDGPRRGRKSSRRPAYRYEDSTLSTIYLAVPIGYVI